MTRLLALLMLFGFIGCQKAPEFNASVAIYPNPFRDILHVQIQVSEVSSVKIYLYRSLEMTAQSAPILFKINETTNPIFEEEVSSGSFEQSFEFSQLERGVHYIDIVVNGASKRFPIVKRN